MIKTLDLRTLGLTEGEHKITVIGKRAYYVQSVASSDVTWSPDRFNITCTAHEQLTLISASETILEGHSASLIYSIPNDLFKPFATVTGASFTESINAEQLTYTVTLTNPISDVIVEIGVELEANTVYDLSAINDKEGQTYGFTYSSTNGLVPGNKSQNNSFAWTKLRFNMIASGTLTLSVYQGSESSYDYGLVSNIDKELTKDSSDVSTNVHTSFKGLSGTKTITFNDVPAGEHFITFKYRKDSSQHTSPDECRITSLSSRCVVDMSLLHSITYNVPDSLSPISTPPSLIIGSQILTASYSLTDDTCYPTCTANGAEVSQVVDRANSLYTITIKNATSDVVVDIQSAIINASASAVESSTTLSSSVACKEGDMIVAAIATRDALTLSDGWTLISTSEINSADTTNGQRLSWAYKTAGSTAENITVTQATAQRLYINMIALPGGTEIIDNGYSYRDDTTSGGLTVEKPEGLVLWGLSCPMWGTAAPYKGWSASNNIPIIELDSTLQQRLGIAVDQTNESTVTFQSGSTASTIIVGCLTLQGIDKIY